MDRQLYRILLSIVSFVFILGVTAGALLAHRMDAGPDSALFAYLQGYAGLVQQDGGIPLWRAFADAFLFPALALAAGFTLFGAAVIPLLLLVRGFLLSFSIAAFVSVFGINGLWLALGELGFQCVFGVPCLIVLSAYGAHMALKLLSVARGGLPGGGAMINRGLVLRLGICTLLLTACALTDAYATPILRDWIAARVFI